MNVRNIINKYVCPFVSLATFDAFVSDSSQTAADLRAAMTTAGEEIMSRAEWSQLYKLDTIASGTSSVDLPDNFHRVLKGNTIYLAATPFTPIAYIRSADVWAQANLLPSSQPYFSIKNGTIKFMPALTADAQFRYMSKNWLESGDDQVDSLTTDGDVPMFPERLLALGTLWRYRRAKGLSWQDYADEFEAMLASEIKADRGIS